MSRVGPPRRGAGPAALGGGLSAAVLVMLATWLALAPAKAQDPPPTSVPAPLEVSLEASDTEPFAGEAVTLRPLIVNAPPGETPSYRWEVGVDDTWLAFGSGPTFSYLAHQPETTSFRVTVSYPSGSSTSAPLSITWKPFVPRQAPDSDPGSGPEISRRTVSDSETASPGWRVAISTGSSEPEVGEWVTLTAEVTNAPEGSDPGYRWEMRGVGPWRAVGTARSFRYAADAPYRASFRVSVSYGEAGYVTSAPLTLRWSSGARAAQSTLIADAGPDQSVVWGASVTLDGSGSTGAVSYTWTQTSGPNVTLTGANTATPTFTAPSPRGESTDLVFQLVVNDGTNDSDPDTVTVTVRPPLNPSSAPCAHPIGNGWAGLNHFLKFEAITNTSFKAFFDDDTPNSNVRVWLCRPDGTRRDLGVRPALQRVTVSNLSSATRYWVAGGLVDGASSTTWKAVTTTGPATLLGAEITSRPASGDTYESETIRAEVTWSQPVTVDNGGSDANVTLRLDLGPDDGDYSNSRRSMSYVSGTGTDTLTFEYTVQVDDLDPDGVWIQTASATDNQVVFLASGATLTGGDPDTNNAGLTLSGLPTTGDANHKVEGPLSPATADAGPDPSVVWAQEVTLDGTGSTATRPNARLVYEWTKISGPAVTLTGADTATPTFTAPSKRGTMRTLVFQLVVNGSEPDTVTVTVRPPLNPPEVPCKHPRHIDGDQDGPESNRSKLKVDQITDTSIRAFYDDNRAATLHFCWTDGSQTQTSSLSNKATHTWGELESATRYWITGWVSGDLDSWTPWVLITTTGSATIRRVALTSSPASGDTYGINEKIQAQLTWSRPVTVNIVEGGSNSDVAMRLDLGADDSDFSNSRELMSYVSGTGTDTLTFEYTVQVDDMDTDGVWLQNAAADNKQVLFLANGATVIGGHPVASNHNAGLTRRFLLPTTGYADHKVDGTSTATADAGPDQTVFFGTRVTLPGSGSSVTEGASLTYTWTQLSGETVTLSGADTATPSFTAPNVRTDLVFQLVVNDGAYDSAPATATIMVRPPLNPSSPPCAHPTGGGNPGNNPDIIISGLGDTSFTVDHDRVSGHTAFWLCRPDGSRVNKISPGGLNGETVTFSDLSSGTRYWVAGGAHPGHNLMSGWKEVVTTGPASLLAARITSSPALGDAYRYLSREKIRAQVTWSRRVTVSNGGSNDNVALGLDLGPDDADRGNSRRLMSYVSGTGTNTLTFEYSVRAGDTDPDGVWVQTASDDDDSVVVLANGATLTGGNPATNNAVLTLSGLPGRGDARQKVEGNSTATADVGADQTVLFGTPVTLSGSGSSTTQGATLTYTWSQIGGVDVTLSGANTTTPSFTAPNVRTDLVFQLVVNDGTNDSGPATVTVEVHPPLNPDSAPCLHPAPAGNSSFNNNLIVVVSKTNTSITFRAATGDPNDLYFCWPDGRREKRASGVDSTHSETVSGLTSGTKHWIATENSGATKSWSEWVAVSTNGGAGIQRVAISSTPRYDVNADGSPETYGLNDKIAIDVTFTQDVTVAGGNSNIRVRLDLGADDSDLANSRKVVNLSEVVDGHTLRFEYTVKAADRDADGVWLQTQSATNDKIVFDVNSATITDASGTAVVQTKSGLPTTGDPDHKVDGSQNNTSPTFDGAPSAFSIAENHADAAIVGTVTATEPDGDSLTYSLAASGDHADFEIDNSGVIRVKANRTFDYETKSSYTVTVEVTDGEDGDGNPEQTPTIDDTIVVTITVTNVEEPPGAPTNVSVGPASSSSVDVTWRAPAQSGALAITDYDLRYYAGSADPSEADWIEEGETNGHTHTGTDRTATITGLAEGTTYRVQVRAEGDGEGAWSTSGSGATHSRPAVSGVAIVSNPGADKTYRLNDRISVRLTFDEAVNVDTADGTPSLKIKMGSALAELAVTYAAGHGTSSLVFRYTVVSPNKSTDGVAVVTNTLALNGGTIESVATGEDAKLGHTGVAHDSNHLVDSSPPAPTGLGAVAGNARTTLSWNNPGDATISKYQHRRSADGGTTWNPDWTDIANSSASTIQHAVTGLTNDTEYTFEVRAVRSPNNPGAGARVTATPRPDPPPAPGGLSADPGNGKVTLSWDDPGDTAISKYRYRARVGNGPWSPDWTEISGSSASTTEHAVTGLTNGSRYTFEVRAVRGAVTAGPAARTTATPEPPPAAPRDVWARAGNAQIVVRWAGPGDSRITKYQHRRSTDGGNTWNPDWTDISGSGAATTSYTAAGLTNGTTYLVAVRAVRGKANPGPSSAVSSTPVATGPAAPAGLRAAPADGEVTLSWDDPGDSTLTRHRVRHRLDTSTNWSSWDVKSSGTITSVTVGSLTNGSSYWFEVAAGTASAWGAASTVGSTPTERPVAPRNFRAIPGNRKIILRWDDPNDAAITTYRYRRSTNGGVTWNPDWTAISGSSATTTSHTFTGLANETTYTIELRSERGPSTLGLVGSASATPKPPPGAPGGLTATAGSEQIELSWTDPVDATITKYQYRARASGGPWSPDWTDITGSGAATTSYTVPGLTNDTTYTVQLRAVRGEDNVGRTSSRTATPKPPKPPAPSGLAAVAGDREIALSWTDPVDATISKYQYRRQAGSGNFTGWTDIPSSGAATTAYTVTGLTNGTTYTVELRSVRGRDTASDPASATATPQPPPVGLVAVAGDGEIALSWTDPVDATISKYQYRRQAGSGNFTGWTDIPSSGAATTAYTVTGLTNGTTYTVELRAIRGVDTEGLAAAIESTPTATGPAAPADLAATPGSGRIMLRWTDPDNDQIGRYQYRVRESGGTWSDWADIEGSGPTTTSFTVTGLTHGTTYEVDLRAVDVNDVEGAVTSAIATPTRPRTSGRPSSGGGSGGAPPPAAPPDEDFVWNTTRDIPELAAGNPNPTGLWSDGRTLLVIENSRSGPDILYAYSLAGGAELTEHRIELDPRNRFAHGIWSDGETIWVADSGQDRLFAYDMQTGERDESKEIRLAGGPDDPRGIWSDGTTMLVLGSLYAYDLETGEFVAGYRLDASNRSPRGIWSDGVTIWVSDHDARQIFAYRVPVPDAEDAATAPQPLTRVPDEEFTLLSQAGNRSPRGIWSDGEVMYVVDASDGRVYAYNMPDAIDTRLASLTLSGVDIGEFSPARTDYAGAAAAGVTLTTIEAAAAQPGAVVSIEPADADRAAEGHQVGVTGGAGITITVTSADGSRSRAYRVSVAPRRGRFVDDDGSVHEDAIDRIAAAGISVGCGPDRYCPDLPVTRAQMATFLARALDLPAAAQDRFEDDDGSVHEDAIDRIAAAGISVGCDSDRFCPDRPVTRAEAAVFLARALDLPAAAEDRFVDDDGSMYEDAIDRIAAAGISVGCGPDRFCPDRPVTRAEMATFLARAFDLPSP